MTRNRIVPPGSTWITSGSASVRSLARKASYFTSFRSGPADALPLAIPAIPGFADMALARGDPIPLLASVLGMADVIAGIPLRFRNPS